MPDLSNQKFYEYMGIKDEQVNCFVAIQMQRKKGIYSEEGKRPVV